MQKLKTIIDEYRKKNGPLPSYPSGTDISHKFWVFYQNPETPRNLLGVKNSLIYRAGLAGIARSKSEPGIDPTTDERAKRIQGE